MMIDAQTLIAMYCQGVFPMAHDDGNIYIYDPDPRAIIPLDEGFRVSRSLRKTVSKGVFDIRTDTDFEGVMRACADRDSTWIDENIIASYVQLHELGFAHSVECWQNDEMVGGLYGVAVGGLFAGESMFNTATDASKVALVHLVERLRAGGFVLLDTQFLTPHLQTFGAYTITREAYHKLLADALRVHTTWV
jgi:leucyl/phenylalanyl-tRNA--protein transferase